jgi:hypothetical protein
MYDLTAISGDDDTEHCDWLDCKRNDESRFVGLQLGSYDNIKSRLHFTLAGRMHHVDVWLDGKGDDIVLGLISSHLYILPAPCQPVYIANLLHIQPCVSFTRFDQS